MSDRELMEMAAKASGMVVAGLADKMLVDPQHWTGGLIVETATGGHKAWNPLTDDGDALRLAVKLRMNMWLYPNGAEVNTDNSDQDYCETNASDATAATRRAIVRAAAEIGKAMP